MGEQGEQQFEAVFYSAPVPSSLRTLAVLALLFDRVHFPGVYIADNVDVEAVREEIERIQVLPDRRTVDRAQLLNCMIYAVQRPFVSDFCVFNGKYGYAGILEEGTEELIAELDRLIFGPPRDGFIPTHPSGFAKGLPGPEGSGVNAPSWIAYPANALLYAAKNDLVIVNDDPSLPFLGIPDTELKANARALSTLLALEAVQLVLPPLPRLGFEGIAELRADTRKDVAPFRRAMLRLSKDLNAAIVSDTLLVDVQKEARFLVETTVLPQLAELRESLANPKRPWYRRAVDIVKDLPQLVGNFVTLPIPMATAQLLSKIGMLLADVRDEQLEAQGIAKRGGFHYLLKIQERGGSG